MAGIDSRSEPLTGAVVRAIGRAVKHRGAAPFPAIAAAVIAAIAEHIAHASPVDPRILEALNVRDDVFYGHACEHCGHDPSTAEGDVDQVHEASADDPSPTCGLIAHQLDPIQYRRYLDERRLGMRHDDAIAAAICNPMIEHKRAGTDTYPPSDEASHG